MTERARALAPLLLLAAIVACRERGGPPLPLPDLDGLEPQVAARISEYAARVRADPDSAGPWGDLGMVLDGHRFLSEAAKCYRRALQLEPDSFAWNYHLAVVSDALDAPFDEVAASFDYAAKLRPDYAPLHCRYGEALSRRGRNDDARRQFERAIAIDPDFAAGHRGLGQVLLALDDAPGALGQLETAARLDAHDPTTFAALAQARMRTGDTQGARAAAERARARLAQSVIPDPVRGEVYALNTSSTAAAARARTAMAAGRYDEAIELLLQADAWNPDSATTQYALGVCYLRTGRRDLAEPRFRAAIRLADDPEARWRLALLLLERGEVDAARDELRRAASGAHESDATLLIQIATGLARAGVPAESLELFERASALGEESAGLHNNWGAALLELDRAEQALEHFRRAMQLDPASANAPLNAGRALERLGRSAEAAALYREALERDPDGPARQRLEQLGR